MNLKISLAAALFTAHSLSYAPAAHSPPQKSPVSKVTVPFVGCPADGQVGPLDLPKGTSQVVHLSKAPRGWHCFETYGSNGNSLFVSPQPIDGKMLFSDTWKGFAGPVIQISVEDGGTSGRFDVARMIAHVFPAHRSFVRKVNS
jgi:hypothetical protein